MGKNSGSTSDRAAATNERRQDPRTHGREDESESPDSSRVAELDARIAILEKCLQKVRREKETLIAAQQCRGKRKRNEERTERREVPQLPDDMWRKILKSVPQKDFFAFASTSKRFRRLHVASGRKLLTSQRSVLE